MRIIPNDMVSDDGCYCDGCGQTLAHGESVLVPDRKLTEGTHSDEDEAAAHVFGRAFALCLGCASDVSRALNVHAGAGHVGVGSGFYRVLRDLREALPLLTGRVVTPEEQGILDAVAKLAEANTDLEEQEAMSDLNHAIGMARSGGWKG